MTINQIIEMLKKSGINSKGVVISMLQNATEEDLIELSKDCLKKVAEKRLENANN